jgi:peptidoglycan/xylan/chitin deacetylase (PgdA/CDA1 family)
MLDPMMRALIGLLAPARQRAKLSIMIFHRVLPRPDPLFPGEVDVAQFDAICGWLKAWFHVLPLDEALRCLSQDRLPARALAITFDDGYADNHDVAMPLLQRHGLCATFYIATGFLDGGRMWNDSVIEALRGCTAAELDLAGTPLSALGHLQLGGATAFGQRRAAIDRVLGAIKYLDPVERGDCVTALAERAGVELPNDLMMSSAQVQALRQGGMQIGAHTVSHPILARLGHVAAEREIVGSKQTLEALLNEPVRQFAYPNGRPGQDYSAESVELVRRLGFDAAVSTAWGVAQRDTDRFQIPRFTPWDRQRLRFGVRVLRNLMAGRPSLLPLADLAPQGTPA